MMFWDFGGEDCSYAFGASTMLAECSRLQFLQRQTKLASPLLPLSSLLSLGLYGQDSGTLYLPSDFSWRGKRLAEHTKRDTLTRFG